MKKRDLLVATAVLSATVGLASNGSVYAEELPQSNTANQAEECQKEAEVKELTQQVEEQEGVVSQQELVVNQASAEVLELQKEDTAIKSEIAVVEDEAKKAQEIRNDDIESLNAQISGSEKTLQEIDNSLNAATTQADTLALQVESKETELQKLEVQETQLEEQITSLQKASEESKVVTAIERETQVAEEVKASKDSMEGKLYIRPTVGTEDNDYAKSIGARSGWAIIDELRDYEIVTQADVDRLLTLSRKDLTKVVLSFKNTTEVTFPKGVYYVRESNWWLVEGTGGNINLTGATFVLDEPIAQTAGFTMSIRATGNQLGRTVIGGTFVGAVETKSVDTAKPGVVNITQSTDSIYNSLIKAENLTFDGQTYVSSVRFGSHAYDLNGVNNVIIKNNTFAGYGGKASWSEKELAHITPIKGGEMNSQHLLYSEAIQLDMAEALGAGLGTDEAIEKDLAYINNPANQLIKGHNRIYGFATLKNDKYVLKDNLLDGSYSKNVTIKDNYFIGYSGLSSKSFINSSNETISRPYSQSVGSHSISSKNPGNYENITITGNHFKDTISPAISAIPERYQSVLFYPIHLMSSINTVEAHEKLGQKVTDNYFDSNIWTKYETSNPTHGAFIPSGEADPTYIGWYKSDTSASSDNAELEKLQKQLSEVIAKLKVGKGELDTLRKNLSKKEAEKTQLVSQLSAAKTNLTTLNNQLTALKNVPFLTVKQQEQYDSLQASLKVLQLKLSQATSQETIESDKLKAEVAKLEKLRLQLEVLKTLECEETKETKHGDSVTEEEKPVAVVQVEVLVFETRTIYDEDLLEGQTIVEQEGQNGKRTYIITPEGEVDLEKLPALERVVRVGIKKQDVIDTKLELRQTAEGVDEYEVTTLNGQSSDKLVRQYKNIARQVIPVPYRTVEEHDASLAKGERLVTTPGVVGQNVTGTTYTVVDGQLVVTDHGQESVAPVNEVVRVGTKEIDASQDVQVTTMWRQTATGAELVEIYSLADKTISETVIEIKTSTRNEVMIPFKIELFDDATLTKGSKLVVQKGIDGKELSGITYTVVNGELLATPLFERIEPVTERIAMGTAVDSLVKPGGSSEEVSAVATPTVSKGKIPATTEKTQPVTTSTSRSTAPAKATLPNTGESVTVSATLGSIILSLTAAMFALKKRKN